MHDLLRLARLVRWETSDARAAFGHRIRVGLVVAAVILVLSLLR